MARSGAGRENIFFYRNLIFQKLIPKKEILEADVVIGFDTASHIIAQKALQAGKKFILEQTILDPEAKEEALRTMGSRYPKWFHEAGQRFGQLLKAERQEQQLADLISVPSKYVGSSLVRFGVSQEKIFVNPYGCNPLPEVLDTKKKLQEKGCRFLFGGTVTGRKGIPLLLDAWTKVASSAAHLTIAGDLTGWPAGALKPANVYFLGKLSRQALAEAYQNHDVFVFPSYAEGMPLVVLEAMGCGLPVIATPVTEGLVKDGVNGVLIPFDNPSALSLAINNLAEDRTKRIRMGQAAKKTASEFSWEAYGIRYANMLEGLRSS